MSNWIAFVIILFVALFVTTKLLDDGVDNCAVATQDLKNAGVNAQIGITTKNYSQFDNLANDVERAESRMEDACY